MPAASQVARRPDAVKVQLVERFKQAVDELFERADEIGTGRRLELAVWALLLAVGRDLLTALLALACWRATRRVAPNALIRFDRDYWHSQTTILGRVTVPLFAYRDGPGRTHAPARREVFPLHPGCRSSEL